MLETAILAKFAPPKAIPDSYSRGLDPKLTPAG